MWPALAALTLLALLWACRGAPLGVAVADDYSFLARQRFQHPLDPFDSMGAAYYWRPLSRQLYFSLVGPWLLAAPWGDALLHILLLLAIAAVLYRLARRGFDAPVAAAIAAFPLVSEPVRALLAWPSGAQHLLATLFATLALHETVAGRKWTAGLAALAGLLSHETAWLAVPLLPLIAWFRTREWRAALAWAGVAALVVGVWAAGYAVALRHGVLLPVSGGHAVPIRRIPWALALALRSGFNLEDLEQFPREPLVVGYGAALLLAAGFAFGRATRARLTAATPVLAAGLAWFLLGAVPLTAVYPDWNAWRASLPVLGFGFTLTALLGLARPWLAWALVAMRLAAVLAAPVAPKLPSSLPPDTQSHMSFFRLARLQLTTDGTRRILMARYPRLPRGAAVRYWSMPQLTEVAFQGSNAVRVWYGDSTAIWHGFGEMAGFHERVDALLEYEEDKPVPFVLIEQEAYRCMKGAFEAMDRGDFHGADAMLAAAVRALPSNATQACAMIARNQARAAFNLQEYARADSFNRIGMNIVGADATYWIMESRLRYMRGDATGAMAAIRNGLALEPDNKEGLQLVRVLNQLIVPVK